MGNGVSKKLAGAAVAIALVALAGYWSFARRSNPGHNDGEAGSASPLAPPKNEIRPATTDDPSSQKTPQASDASTSTVGIATDHPFPGVSRSRRELPLEGDPFAPTSKEEQEWLDRNGFPNAEQVHAYSTSSDAALEQAVAAGDLVAQVELDGRRVRMGDRVAQARLMAATAAGSNYALTTLAVYLGRPGPGGEPARAYALTRVAEMLGDYKMGLLRDFIVSKPLDPSTRLKAEAEALKMYQNIVDERRKRQGPAAAIVDPRPLSGT
jgi:hypothetical protein